MDSLTMAVAFAGVITFIFLASGLWIGLGVGGAGMLLYMFFIKGGGFYPISVLQYNIFNSITWTSMSLFIFMGVMIYKSGLGENLYKFASVSVGVLPGGLLHTNIISCAIFAACTGSSIACAATMGSIAIPELRKRGYDKKLVLGSLAASGTLGIMIPPSIGFIVYGAIVGESIGKLFIAGIFPGLMLVGLFMIYIAVACIISPEKTPGREQFSSKEFLVRLMKFLPVGLIILLVLGAIYFGVATATESAALGSVAAVVLTAIYRRLTWKAFSESVLQTVVSTGMIFLCVVGCQIMGMALADLRIPAEISLFVAHMGFGKLSIFICIVILYLILGCFIDATSMVLLTLPVTYPLMMGLGFDSVWFGVIVTLLCEIGQITPPVGVNLFVIQGLSNEELSVVATGAFPFVILMILGIALLYVFPEMTTWLPAQMSK
jgi:C4-dicarboxylate transporter, DctM subunit